MEMSKVQILRALCISTFLHLLIASAKAFPNNGNPQQRQQKLSSEAQEYLAAHNNFRRKKGVAPLQWEEKLAKYAHSWAEQHVNDCNPKNHSNGPYGENTLWLKYDEYTPEKVTQVWINEEKYYDHHKFSCKCQPTDVKCMCGHYTQVVWGSTQKVGCASATCNHELGTLFICSYDPPGNYPNVNPLHKSNFGGAAPLSRPPPSPRPPTLNQKQGNSKQRQSKSPSRPTPPSRSVPSHPRRTTAPPLAGRNRRLPVAKRNHIKRA